MIEQARLISTWGPNVYVKLPVTTTRGEPLFDAVGLSRDGIQINLTAVFISQQVASASKRSPEALPLACRSSPAISPTPALIIAPIMRDAVAQARRTTNVEIIWARRGRSST
jgi:transaldolase